MTPVADRAQPISATRGSVWRLPLTHPGGVQAWTIAIPRTQSTPTLHVHDGDGDEWLYVLSGRDGQVH